MGAEQGQALLEQGLEFGIVGAGNQGLAKGGVDRGMIGCLAFRISAIEGRAVERREPLSLLSRLGRQSETGGVLFRRNSKPPEKRQSLPFSVRWDGTLYVPADGTYQFWLTASGPGTLRIDGRQVAKVDADGRDTAEVSLPLTQGSHPIRVTYARRASRSPDRCCHT